MQVKHKKRIYAVNEEGAVIHRTCQKWFTKFHAGDFLPDNVAWSGRPAEVDDDQIKTLTENNQRYTMQKINLHTENIQIKY